MTASTMTSFDSDLITAPCGSEVGGVLAGACAGVCALGVAGVCAGAEVAGGGSCAVTAPLRPTINTVTTNRGTTRKIVFVICVIICSPKSTELKPNQHLKLTEKLSTVS